MEERFELGHRLIRTYGGPGVVCWNCPSCKGHWCEKVPGVTCSRDPDGHADGCNCASCSGEKSWVHSQDRLTAVVREFVELHKPILFPPQQNSR